MPRMSTSMACCPAPTGSPQSLHTLQHNMERRSKCTPVRISNPCDTCVLRRVKCDTERPCPECRKRGLECTSLRARKKRGPKGPREATSASVRALISNLTETPDRRQLSLSAERGEGANHQSRTSPSPTSCAATEPSVASRQLPLSAYRQFIEIFRARLYPIWPVLSPDRLLSNMESDETDFETHSLAAALCAATISQLRLAEHTDSRDSVSSLAFALDAEQLRTQYDYRENGGLPSLLTAFFLHMYYANANKLRTAALFLREAITCAQTMRLGLSDTLIARESREQTLRLRIYWLLFISEKYLRSPPLIEIITVELMGMCRTFAAQNGLPPILQPIEAMPPYEDDPSGADLHAFASLTQLFSFVRSPMQVAPGHQLEPEGTELAAVQDGLASDENDAALNDTQRVDLCVTRQWIRTLTWEHMTRHFRMSSHPRNPAFSLVLPVQIGRELLSFFTTVDPSHIRSHGYGMVRTPSDPLLSMFWR